MLGVLGVLGLSHRPGCKGHCVQTVSSGWCSKDGSLLISVQPEFVFLESAAGEAASPLSQGCFGCLESLKSHVHCRVDFAFLPKYHFGIWTEIALNL